MMGDGHSETVEVVHAVFGFVVVDDVAVEEEEDHVELEEYLGGGLVDGGYHCSTGIGESVQEFY
jgi:hypothetical protein